LKRLLRDFFERPTLNVANDLLGKVFIIKQNENTLSGRLVEVEAYIGQDDPACHARLGKTNRNAVMFGQGGFTYVYFIYGMYNMLNFVTESAERPAAVLIRAMEPLDGIKVMKKNRNTDELINLTNGPGKLCQAFGLTTKHSRIDLITGNIYVADDGYRTEQVVRSSRIGIREGLEKDWRFYISGNKFVSKV